MSNEDDIRITKTGDGSFTVFSNHFQETYHSIHGAYTESMHVFIRNGLIPLFDQKADISILEVGMGTGMNLLLTWLHTRFTTVNIHYTAIEKYPMPVRVLEHFSQEDAFILENLTPFDFIHTSPWEIENSLTLNFKFTKKLQKIEDLCEVSRFDLIYFDAFAPNTQPELWTSDIMEKMWNALKPGGILVTYCAKGAVRRNMKNAGFIIEKLPGPPGKREMTKAAKPV